MADNLAVTPGSGATIASDDISSVHYQRVKVCHGADGSATDVSTASAMPVKQPLASSGTFGAAAPTTSSASAVASNTARNQLLLVNNGSQAVYVGTGTVTTSNGIPIPPGGSLTITTYSGAVHAITASGTGDLRYLET